MEILKHRDLTILNIDDKKVLTIACDSCGGIGESQHDIVKAPYDIVGYFTARVCLFETLCFLASPMVIVNNFCVEMEKRGQALLKGINQCIDEYNNANFNTKLLANSVTGSTEENFNILTTALGVTIIGEKDKSNIIEQINKGNLIISVGIPKFGQEVLDDIYQGKNEVISFKGLSTLVNKIKTKDLLPVGSKGILYEIKELEKTHNIKVDLYENINIDLSKSSGPATTILAIIEKQEVSNVKELIIEPINILGEVK